MVCTGCCATLDHIVTYLFKKVTNKGSQNENFGEDKCIAEEGRREERWMDGGMELILFQWGRR